MSDEPHDVVKLLIARMESHPEEFRVGDAPFHDRWYDPVNGISAYGSEADKAAMAAGLRKIRLGEIHERVMDELLNGEERRRKVEEDREYERRMSQSLLLTKQQMMQQAQQGLQNAYSNTYANQLGQAQGLQNANALGQLGAYDYDLDRYRNTPIGSITGTKANSIMIDDEELDASMIKKMKRMMSGRSK
jgi:hypothetical protein